MGLLVPIAVVEAVGAAASVVHKPYGSDFALYYGVSTIGLQSGFGNLYDESRRVRVWAELGSQLGGPLAPYPVIQPPTTALFTAPLAALPFGPAYAIWLAVIAGSVLLAWWLAAPGTPLARAGHLVAMVALLPIGLGLFVGQVVFIVFAAVLAGWWLLRRGRDLVAGLVLVLILLKPQEAALVPLVLVVIGRYRAFVAWACGALVFGLGAMLAIGPQGVSAYASRLSSVSSHPQAWVSVPNLSVPSLVGGGYAGLAAAAAVIALALYAAWVHRDSNLELPLAIGLVGSLAATPYLHEPDTVMLVAAAWLWLRTSPATWAAGALVVGYVLIDLGQAPAVGWAPLVILEVAWLGAMAVWRRQPAVAGQPSGAPA
jgi:hypothetical protein